MQVALNSLISERLLNENEVDKILHEIKDGILKLKNSLDSDLINGEEVRRNY